MHVAPSTWEENHFDSPAQSLDGPFKEEEEQKEKRVGRRN